MKETREILKAVSALADGEHAVLATVIDVRGSGYRLPGARMIMLATGETMGTVSGGCLESDVLERAKKVLATGKPEVFTYDTTGDENSVFSMNMGCRGVIRILLEVVDGDGVLIGKLRQVYETRDGQVMATLVSVENNASEIDIGGRAFLNGSGEIENDGLQDNVTGLPELKEGLKNYRPDDRYAFKTIETDDGSFEFAFETLLPPITVHIFGAGADAVPAARIFTELGWRVTVIDHRPAFLTMERFPTAEKLVLQVPGEMLDALTADSRTAAVVMTHNYGRDREILPFLLQSDVAYIGALGPKRRTEQLLEELSAGGGSFTDLQLSQLHAPVGLDIGADTPESIALSIAAEIQSVFANRSGGHLRERQGSIYDRKQPA